MARTDLSITALRTLAAMAVCVEICAAAASDLYGAPVSAQAIFDQFFP
jgi:hypothetical protein